MRKTFTETMLEIGKIDPKLMVLVGDISHFALQPFADACPGRFYNVGICEPTIISMSAGLSYAGFSPVVHTIAPFIVERGFEQIKLDFCYQNIGGNLITVGSAFDYSGLGCTHHCYDDIALIKALPGTEIIYPAMPNEFKILFEQTYKNNKLTYFRLPGCKHETIISDNQIEFGKGILIKNGSDVTLIGVGPHLKTIMESLSLMESNNIDAEVIYLHTIKPFDQEIVRRSVNKTKRIIIMEEHVQYGGVGDEVLRSIHSIDNCRYSSFHIPDQFQRGYGQYKDHCNALGFTSENLLQKALLLCR